MHQDLESAASITTSREPNHKSAHKIDNIKARIYQANNTHIPDYEIVKVAIVDVKLRRKRVEEGQSGYEYEYLCGLCNNYFSSREVLVTHDCFQKPEVNILYECHECKTLFQSLEALTSHMTSHEQQVIVVSSKPKMQGARLGYQCSQCDKCLSSKGSLVKHQKLHDGLKPYGCSFCDKTFSLKGNRDKHELIHAGERPHKCNICDKTFTLKGNLQQHILTHTSLKMYKCQICGSEFTLKGNLSKHIKRHENGWKKKGGKADGEAEKIPTANNTADINKVFEAVKDLNRQVVEKAKPVHQPVEAVTATVEPLVVDHNACSSKITGGLGSGESEKVEYVDHGKLFDQKKQWNINVTVCND